MNQETKEAAIKGARDFATKHPHGFAPDVAADIAENAIRNLRDNDMRAIMDIVHEALMKEMES